MLYLHHSLSYYALKHKEINTQYIGLPCNNIRHYYEDSYDFFRQSAHCTLQHALALQVILSYCNTFENAAIEQYANCSKQFEHQNVGMFYFPTSRLSYMQNANAGILKNLA